MLHSSVKVPVWQVSCQHLRTTSMQAQGGLMGHQWKNSSNELPKTSAWLQMLPTWCVNTWKYRTQCLTLTSLKSTEIWLWRLEMMLQQPGLEEGKRMLSVLSHLSKMNFSWAFFFGGKKNKEEVLVLTALPWHWTMAWTMNTEMGYPEQNGKYLHYYSKPKHLEIKRLDRSPHSTSRNLVLILIKSSKLLLIPGFSLTKGDIIFVYLMDLL